jgi:hypothetical protein
MFSFLTAQASRPGDGELILSVFGVANDSVEEVRTDERDNKYNYGFGALIEANYNSFVGIETGAIFVKRQYEYGVSGFSLVQQVNRLHVPVVAKFWPTNFLALGVGPYVSFKTGSVKNTLEIGTLTGSANTNADDQVEFGLDMTATLNFSVADKTGLFIEGRYSKPFDEGKNTSYENLTALAGVKVSL